MIERAREVSRMVILGVALSSLLSLTPVRAQDQKDTQPYVSDVRQIKNAGIQFEKPKPWAETAEKGRIVLLIERGRVSITFAVEDKYEELITGIKSGLSGSNNTEVWTDGERTADVRNGVKHLRESGYVVRGGVRVKWIIDVYQSRKNVIMFTFGAETTLASHIDEYTKFLESIQPI